MNNWRLYLIVALMILSIIDLTATYLYVSKYKKWQPEKSYNLIERNPLLVFLWSKFGLEIGMIIGSVIILALVFLVGKDSYWWLVTILFLVLCWTMYNHWHNFNLLNKLIEQYPTGHLPEKIFGVVQGNR